MARIPEISLCDAINDDYFDVAICALLKASGAEKYTDIFRFNSIGQCTLVELTNEDLIQLGIDDQTIRYKLLEEVKNLPIYNEMIDKIKTSTNLNLIEIVNILEDSSEQLYRIYLSMMTNTLALKKENVVDYLLDNDKYSSQISLCTLNCMKNNLNSMEIALHNQVKELSNQSKQKKIKKVIVTTIGSAVIAFLGICFVRSLKNL